MAPRSLRYRSGSGSCGMRTKTNVARRTKGKTISSVGKAMAQDKAQEPSHKDSSPGAKPTLRKVLTSDITQVMMTDRNKGITTEE